MTGKANGLGTALTAVSEARETMELVGKATGEMVNKQEYSSDRPLITHIEITWHREGFGCRRICRFSEGIRVFTARSASIGC